MRLSSLTVKGFRGFADEYTFDLNADTIVVVGANGNGKTCIFDSILWALTGSVPRLECDNKALVSRFSSSGAMRVQLNLASDDHDQISIVRSFDGSNARLALTLSGEESQGLRAESDLVGLLWPHAAASSTPGDAIATAITRSVYLQQDLVRQFIESDDRKKRFAVVSELVGAGRVTDLLRDLESAKQSWTRRTTALQKELQPSRDRLDQLTRRVKEIEERRSGVSLDEVQDRWAKWWTSANELGVAAQPMPATSRSASAHIGNAVRELAALAAAQARKNELVQSVLRDLKEVVSQTKPELPERRAAVQSSTDAATKLQQQVAEERAKAAERRSAQAALEEKSAQLGALAELALKNLDERCPVCRQEYDHDGTREYLQSLQAEPTSPAEAPPDEHLASLLKQLSEKEAQLAQATAQLQLAEREARALEEANASVARRLDELEIDAESPADASGPLETTLQSTAAALRRLQTAQRDGEALAVTASQLGDEATLEELRREVLTLQHKITSEKLVHAKRESTGTVAQQVIEALRDAGNAVVTERLNQIEIILQGIYSRIDPHPAFSAVGFLTDVVRGHGQLMTSISDPQSNVSDSEPEKLLSSSQMNALAVSVFLSLNLGVPKLPLHSAILDDPLQSLDDINLLGLIDLLRRTKDTRQLCLSTHDERFGRLLARKLRPSDSTQRTVMIELEGWSRNGPQVRSYDIEPDAVSLRLVGT